MLFSIYVFDYFCDSSFSVLLRRWISRHIG